MFERRGSVGQKQLQVFSAARTAGVNRHAALNTPVGQIDISWLEAASAYHRVSADPNDYIFSINRIVVADIPNRNMDAFPAAELNRYHTIAGREVYKTFEGKPLYYEHNQVPTDARGLIFKSFITPEGPYRIVTNVVGADRKKDPDLAKAIYTGVRPYFSMGCIAEQIQCPICSKLFTEPREFCGHIQKLGQIFNGQLSYEILRQVTYIEESSVGDPAALMAGKENMDLDLGVAVPARRSL